MTILFRLTWFVVTLVLLSACGQKGPLFLPTKPPAISTPYPSAQPNPAPPESSDSDD